MSERRDMKGSGPGRRKKDKFKSEIADKESGGATLEGMPIGEDDFRELRRRDLFFIDKSMFVDRILRSKAKVILITRPRRFGKSLNLSMTDAYFNIKYADGPDYFEGLMISEARPDDPEKNSNPVIKLDFADLDAEDGFDDFIESFQMMMRDAYRRFPELKGSEKLDETLEEIYGAVIEGTTKRGTLKQAIRYLCEMLETHYGKKPIVLIDEYDNPMNNAYHDRRLHDKVVKFLRRVFKSTLKGNSHLRFAVLTGVMKISQESIFSGLNNTEIDDVFSAQYDEMFGFTQDEVEWLLRENGREDRIDEAREWYDGYRFGDEDVYNPWSIINYVKQDCRSEGYWAGTSGNSIVGDLISGADQKTWRDLRILCGGGSIESPVQRSVAYCDLRSSGDVIYSVMVAAGYLKAVRSDDGYVLTIPNKEVSGIFIETILNRFGRSTCEDLRGFIDAMTSGDVDELKKHLEALMEIPSIRILTHEFQYEAFIAGLMAVAGGRYEVKADYESGDGFFDIRMKRLSGSGDNVVVELKRRNKKNKDVTMDDLAHSALQQIHEKRYYSSLEGETILYGIAFNKKTPTIIMEKLANGSRRRSQQGGRAYPPPILMS